MQLQELSDRIHKLANTWEHYKSVNDQRLKDVEKKRGDDGLAREQLARINTALDQQQARLQQVETVMSRPESRGEMGVEEKSLDADHRNAFREYLRKGIEKPLNSLEKKSLSSEREEEGGYLLTRPMQQFIADQMGMISPMRQISAVEHISTDTLDLMDTHDKAEGGWTTETGVIHETSTPKFSRRSIRVFELYAQPKATQKLIDDAAINLEAWLQQHICESFANIENASFTHGDGKTQPRGILSYPHGKGGDAIEQRESKHKGMIEAEDLIKLQYALKETYLAKAHFMMHRSTVESIRLLRNEQTKEYLWNPSLVTGQPATVLGIPVMQSADMPVIAEGSLPVILADFKSGYQIVDRMGVRLLRDPYTEKPFVKFYVTKRVGGDVKRFNAIKILRMSK